MYHIKQVSQITGVSTESIRYYERIGIMPPPRRADNKYRQYDDQAVQRLSFIRRARYFDFSLDHIREILTFRDKGIPPCDFVLDLVRQKTNDIQDRIRDLEQLRDELEALQKFEQSEPTNAKTECVCQILETRY